jgi:HD-GYP domain-containing protein (c-di-GMP phosphodiesterase class II)
MSTGAVDFLEAALDLERAGDTRGAIEAYTAAAVTAAREHDVVARATALRRCASIHRRRQEFDEAIALCETASEIAVSAGEHLTAAEVLNTLALVHIDQAQWSDATARLTRAWELGSTDPLLAARIEQNLGIIANIRGDLANARRSYLRSLRRFRQARDQQGCAIAYHNLGMLTADRRQWQKADSYLTAGLKIAIRTGDVPLQASLLLNRSEVEIGLIHYERALGDAEQALDIFVQLGNLSGQADAHRLLGVVFREMGMIDLAEQQLRAAVTSATASKAPLQIAEAHRDVALLLSRQERNLEALAHLDTAHRAYGQLAGVTDDRSVTADVDELEKSYRDIVAKYAQSIESRDTYTDGHSARVASYAVAIAERLGLGRAEVMTVSLAASLCDIGKARVPATILAKPGTLTAEELAIVRMHPIRGLEMLTGTEFPWPVKPIIRSHHEKVDGSGYPDGLAGDAVPLHAQIVGIADVFDALTSARSYQTAAPPAEAAARMRELAHWWCPDAFAAFSGAIAQIARKPTV